MADSRWWTDLDVVIAAALPAGSRVLDVGCGDGGLTDRLAELGFDAVGVDPAAPARPRLISEPLEHVRSAGPFDAAVAVMALHHAELDAVTSALTRLLRPRAKLFVYGFDWAAYDDQAATWLARHDHSDADNSVAGWQREHDSLHAGATVRQALAARFDLLREVSRPYLARMLARRDLESVEHALIDARMLPALGFWVIAGRPG